jgi:hypothetical protein
MGTIGIAHAPAGLAGLLALGAAACGSVGNKAPDAAIAPDAATDGPAGPDAALAWSPLAEIAVNYPDQIRTPVVSEDGLTIYFLAQVTANGAFDFDIYSASRASTSDGFGVATAVLNVNVAGQEARYPDLSSDGRELYFSGNDLGPIMVATRSNVSSAFGAPTAVRTGVAGNFPSISENKLALYYLAPTVPPGNADGMVMLTTRAAVGQPWSAPTMVTVSGAIQIYSSIDISSDELALLRAPTLAPASHNLLISRRTSKTAAFDQTEVLQAADGATAFASARWSAHDTEIWVGKAVGSVERPFVSRLR